MRNKVALCVLILSQVSWAVTFGGSGCPKGTHESSVNGDGSVLFTLRAFHVKSMRLNCDIVIPVEAQPGRQARLPVVELDSAGSVRVETFFAGSTGHWSPCGQAVNLRVKMSALTPSTVIRSGSIQALKWRSCR